MNSLEKLKALTTSDDVVVPVSLKFLNELQTELEALQALRIADRHLISRSNFRMLEKEIIKYHSNTLITGKLLCFNIYGYCMELYYKITPEMYERMEKGDYVVEFIVVGQTPYYQLLSEIIK